jgi:hypothetical protein
MTKASSRRLIRHSPVKNGSPTRRIPNTPFRRRGCTPGRTPPHGVVGDDVRSRFPISSKGTPAVPYKPRMRVERYSCHTWTVALRSVVDRVALRLCLPAEQARWTFAIQCDLAHLPAVCLATFAPSGRHAPKALVTSCSTKDSTHRPCQIPSESGRIQPNPT